MNDDGHSSSSDDEDIMEEAIEKIDPLLSLKRMVEQRLKTKRQEKNRIKALGSTGGISRRNKMAVNDSSLMNNENLESAAELLPQKSNKFIFVIPEQIQVATIPLASLEFKRAAFAKTVRCNALKSMCRQRTNTILIASWAASSKSSRK